MESGEVEFIEDVCEGVMAGLRAGAYGLPFMPSAIALDSELVPLNVKRGGIWKIIKDPFNDQELIAVKAIRPDVALVHVHRADERVMLRFMVLNTRIYLRFRRLRRS